MQGGLFRLALLTGTGSSMVDGRREAGDTENRRASEFFGMTNSIGMKLVMIPAGTFVMGSPKEEEDRNPDDTSTRLQLASRFTSEAKFGLRRKISRKTLAAPALSFFWPRTSPNCMRASVYCGSRLMA